MIIFINAEKTINKIQYSLMIKMVKNIGIEKTHLNTTKVINAKLIVNIILNC